MNRRKFLRNSVSAAVGATLAGNFASAAMFPSMLQVSADVVARSGDGAEVAITRTAAQELADALRGPMLLPGSEAYEDARHVLNASINKHPALIVQPTGVADISTAVQFAKDYDLLVAVKCGGHSFSGKSTCDGGMMIDLSLHRDVRVDPARRVAYVTGGSHLGPIDHESMAHGLATTAGTVSHTGVGGLTTGGGFGRLARRFGLALDNVISVDVVTADGKLRHANKDENPDLHWGVRGAGGNFGIVTSFEFQLHPMNRLVYGGNVVFPFKHARDVLFLYSQYANSAPNELYMDIAIGKPPGDAPGFAMLHACYSGDPKNAEKLIEPIRKIGTPLVDDIKWIDYVAIQRSWDSSDPRALANYMKAGFVSGIDEKLIDSILAGVEGHPEGDVMVYFQHSGGAIGDVATDVTAFAQRDAMANMLATVSWNPAEDMAPHRNFIKNYWDTLAPFTNGFYVNEIDQHTRAVVDSNYGSNLERLVRTKNQYDPTNLFRLNANVLPTV